MIINDIVNILVKFFSLYVLYQLLFHSVMYVSVLGYSGDISDYSPGIVIFFYMLIIFLFFWFKSDFVAEKITGKDKEKSIEAKFKVEDFEKAGFAIVGMFILVESIPKISNISLAYFMGIEKNFSYQYLQVIISVIVGLILIFGASGIANILKKIRS